MLRSPQVKAEQGAWLDGEDMAGSVTCQGASGKLSGSWFLNAVQAPES